MEPSQWIDLVDLPTLALFAYLVYRNVESGLAAMALAIRESGKEMTEELHGVRSDLREDRISFVAAAEENGRTLARVEAKIDIALTQQTANSHDK